MTSSSTECSFIKEVFGYNGSIHQLKRWYQELLVYECVCIHRPSKMMKDVDGVCCHIEPLYIDILLTLLLCVPRTSFYDPLPITLIFFPTYSNPRHISHKDISPAFGTVSTITTPSVLHYYPIHFSSNLKSLPTTSNISPLLGFEVPPNNIISLSFDVIIHSFASELISWSGSIVQYYMLEKSTLYFRIASYLHFHSSLHFTTRNMFLSSSWPPPLQST